MIGKNNLFAMTLPFTCPVLRDGKGEPPGSPRLNCPTVHCPEEESHVLRAGLREGALWPGQVPIPQADGAG